MNFCDSSQIIQSSKLTLTSTSIIGIQRNGVVEHIPNIASSESPLKSKSKNKIPTPGGPLTEERIKELGVIKMNDYLSNGTRPQFWEEYFVKVIMHVS